MRVEPSRKGAMALAQGEDAPRVLDDGGDLGAVADDARVRKEPPPVGRAVGCDGLEIEGLEGASKGLALLQDRQPRKPRLVDLERQPLEERGVPADREAVLLLVVGPVPGMAGRGLPTSEEKREACCYALQEKFWVTDPDGNRWEVYTVLEDIEQKAEPATACCQPNSATPTACC